MMHDLSAIPVWAAAVAAVLMVTGATFTLLGTWGLVRLDSFYQRVHAPTLGTSWGVGGLVLASMIVFSYASGDPVLHAALVAVFVTITTPVTLMLLGRSALYRDRSEGSAEVPQMPVQGAGQPASVHAPEAPSQTTAGD